jgi:hypothetical protein
VQCIGRSSTGNVRQVIDRADWPSGNDVLYSKSAQFESRDGVPEILSEIFRGNPEFLHGNSG